MDARYLTVQEAEDILTLAGDDVESIDQLVTHLVIGNVKIDEDTSAGEEEVSAEDLEKVLDAEGAALDDPVRMYLREIGRGRLLRGDEEVNLAQAMRDGDAEIGKKRRGLPFDQATIDKGLEARRQLTEVNLRLVFSMAKKYIGRGTNLLDLIQEGNIGLIRAVEKFDHTKGYKFSTYATWWIRQAMTLAVRAGEYEIEIERGVATLGGYEVTEGTKVPTPIVELERRVMTNMFGRIHVLTSNPVQYVVRLSGRQAWLTSSGILTLFATACLPDEVFTAHDFPQLKDLYKKVGSVVSASRKG